MQEYQEYEALYGKLGDSCEGTIIAKTRYGLYLTLDNGETAYAHFGTLLEGTKVSCSYLKPPDAWNHFALVGIDSVYENVA